MTKLLFCICTGFCAVFLLSGFISDMPGRLVLDEMEKTDKNYEMPNDEDIDQVSENGYADDAAVSGVKDSEAIPKENVDFVQITDWNGIKPNETGQIMIVMYHSIVDRPAKNNLERSVDDFKNDLRKLYDNGYRLETIAGIINNEVRTEAGRSPVVLTFDDGWSTAFSLEEAYGSLIPAKNCAVDIINEFCEENPSFGKGAVFYINGYNEPFKGAGSVYDRLSYLVLNGYELGNHTYSHSNLSLLAGESIQNEILSMELYVRHILPDCHMLTFSYPYGERPKNNAEKNLALNGSYEGNVYEYHWALSSGPTSAQAAVNHIDFDPLNIPRVRGTDNAAYDLNWYIDYYERNPGLRYVSDGDPDVISVPLENKDSINYDSLGGKALNLY